MVTYLGVVDVGYVVVDITFEPRFASKRFAQSESRTLRMCEVVDLDNKEGPNMSRVESFCPGGGDSAKTNDGTKFGGERVFPRYVASSRFL